MDKYAALASNPAAVAAFWAAVSKSDGCWEWTGATTNGYGRFTFQGIACSAHKLSFRIANGQQIKRVIRHSCNNRPCVRPDHLIDGTHAENTMDMVRSFRGTAKLRPPAVLDIRASVGRHDDTRAIAAMMVKYSVSATTIISIVKRRTWAWL